MKPILAPCKNEKRILEILATNLPEIRKINFLSKIDHRKAFCKDNII